MHRYQRIIIGLFLILSLISACSPAPMIEKEVENTPEPEPTTTPVVPTEIEEIIDGPIPVIDVSEWIVTIGAQECSLVSLGDEYPGWYMADCPEQLWFPIGQTSPIEINLLDSETCAISSIDDFKIAIQDISIDAMPVEFVQMDEGGWGCQIPYSDTAGIEVVCGLEVDCEGIGEELRVLIFGKTIRVYSGGNGSSKNGGSVGNGGGQTAPPPPPPHPRALIIKHCV